MNTKEQIKFVKNVNRRHFIKSSTLLVGGVAACGLPAEQSAFVNPTEKQLKISLVGCGKRGTGALTNSLKADANTRLVALADVFDDRISSCIESLKKVQEDSNELKDNLSFDEILKYTGFDAYKKAIDHADVVILATPPGFRPDHLAYAINQGKHIFCEKPIAVDPQGIRKVLELIPTAEEKKLNIVVGLQRRYETKYHELIQRIHQGEIGEVVSGQVCWDSEGVWVKERLPNQTELQYQMNNWYYFNWLSGDHIVEQHVHNIDVFNWAKQAYPVSAKGIGGRQSRVGKEFGEIYDHHYVEFTYEDGSVLNSRCSHIKGSDTKVGETIVGSKGKAEILYFKNGWIADHSGKKLYRHREKNDPNPYQVEHDELFKSIRSGDVINDLEYGTKSTLTAIMGRYATYTGQVIKWEDVLNYDHSITAQINNWQDDPPILPDKEGFYPVAIPGKTKFYQDSWMDKQIEDKPILEKALNKLDLLEKKY